MRLLKDIVSIEKGKRYDLLDEFQEGATRVFQANDFRNENKPQYTFESDGVIANEDDILVVWDGSVGQMGFGKNGYVGSTIVRVRVKNKKEYSPFFIYKFLQTKSEFLKRKSTGATIQHINRKSLEQLVIPSINISDQIQIANILSKAEALIEQRKQSIALLDEFLKSCFLEMFGDPTINRKQWKFEVLGKYISTLTDYHANGSYESLRDNVVLKKEPDYALMVRTTDLEKNDFTTDCNFIDEKTYNFLEKSKVFGGEIIINKIGSAGKVYLMPYLNRPTSLGMNSFLLRFSKEANSIFIYYLLTSDFGKNSIDRLVKGAVTKTITKDAVRSIKIPVPPLELQNQFVNIVNRIEALKVQYKNSLLELGNLFGSLSQKAFKGELSIISNSSFLRLTIVSGIFISLPLLEISNTLRFERLPISSGNSSR